MSPNTWTLTAVASEVRQIEIQIWRAVESQHQISTRSITDTAAEQDSLEQIVEEVKPPLPSEGEGLHFLLSTPFRYLSPIGTRFRGPLDPGVFYGADEVRAACAELGYWQWRFLVESPQLTSIDWRPRFIFAAQVSTGMVDLRLSPFKRDRKIWMAKNSYAGTQDFARICRSAGVGGILYQSVRDPEAGCCAAILTPKAFKGPPDQTKGQNWLVYISRNEVVWRRDTPFQTEEFIFTPAYW